MTDLTPDKLDQIEKAAKEVTAGPWWTNARWSQDVAATTLALVARVRELEAQVERVRELHKPFQCEHCKELGIVDGCVECGDESDWPCDTIKALGEES